MSNTNHIAQQAARVDAQLINTGDDIENLIKSRMAGGIVSDPLYTAYLCHYLTEDMQVLLLRVLEKHYFDY
jgi:hypothetical protein